MISARRARLGPAWGALLVVLAYGLPALAAAGEDGGGEGAGEKAKAPRTSELRLGLDVRLFEFAWSRIRFDFLNDVEPAYRDTDRESVGFDGAADFGASAAWSLRRHASVGARLALGYTRRNATASAPSFVDYYDYKEEVVEREVSKAFTWAVLPFFELAFLDGAFRPFLALTIGAAGAKEIPDQASSVDDSEIDQIFFVLGLGGGVHVFVGDRASLDLWALESLRAGTWSKYNYEFSVKHRLVELRTELFVGVSLWI